MPKSITDANFDINTKELAGVQKQRQRWQRAVGALNGALGEAVGNIYIKSHYPAESERQMTAAHHDTHDVFVLQVDGCKRWNIYPPVHPLPLADQAGVGRDEDGRLVAENATPLL